MLPRELIELTLSWLNYSEIIIVGMTCSAFYTMINDLFLWVRLLDIRWSRLDTALNYFTIDYHYHLQRSERREFASLAHVQEVYRQLNEYDGAVLAVIERGEISKLAQIADVIDFFWIDRSTNRYGQTSYKVGVLTPSTLRICGTFGESSQVLPFRPQKLIYEAGEIIVGGYQEERMSTGYKLSIYDQCSLNESINFDSVISNGNHVATISHQSYGKRVIITYRDDIILTLTCIDHFAMGVGEHMYSKNGNVYTKNGLVSSLKEKDIVRLHPYGYKEAFLLLLRS